MPKLRYVGSMEVELRRGDGERELVNPGDVVLMTPSDAAGCACLPEHPYGIWERVLEEPGVLFSPEVAAEEGERSEQLEEEAFSLLSPPVLPDRSWRKKDKAKEEEGT